MEAGMPRARRKVSVAGRRRKSTANTQLHKASVFCPREQREEANEVFAIGRSEDEWNHQECARLEHVSTRKDSAEL